MNDIPPIKNIRSIKMLFADAAAQFAAMAQEAELVFIEEATEAGTRYVIDFASLADARIDHPLIRQLTAISTDPANDEYRQICLEPK